MKGLLYSLEAVIAILIIAMFFISTYSPREPLPEFDVVNWKLRGFEALKLLDDSNRLRDAVITNSTGLIKDRLSSLLPAQLNYEVVVCDRNCGKPDIQADKLTSVVYILSGDLNNYLPRQIILYLW